MAKQPFRFTLFLLMCLLVASTAAAQVEIAAVPSADNPAIGDTIEVSINIAGASNVIGYGFKLTFDPTALEFIDAEHTDYLPAGARAPDPIVENGSVTLGAVVLGGKSEDDGTLAVATLAVATFKVLVDTETTVGFEDAYLLNSTFTRTAITLITGATINSTASGEDMTVGEDVVNIPDPDLRAAVETAFGKAPSTPITVSEIAALAQFSAPNANITYLTGLEDATNLSFLDLTGNSISNISPLAGLTNLTQLHLSNNSISDISAVAGLTNLINLYLGGNSISNISPLARLTNLTELRLNNNSISDISSLSGLTNLRWLSLDVNSISDISPLVANTGLGSGDTVDVRGNLLNYPSIYTRIPVPQSRGVEVLFDSRTPTTPQIISGDAQSDTVGVALAQPFVVEVRDENGAAFEGVPVVFTVTAGGGTVQPEITTTGANGLAQSTLTLGNEPGTNTVTVSVEGIAETTTFNAEASLPPPMPTALEGVSGDSQNGLTGERLMNPFVVEVRDQYDDPMEGVTVAFAISAGSGSLSHTSTITDANGLAQSTLTLGSEPGTNTVTVSVEGIAETTTFNAEASLPPPIPTSLEGISGNNQTDLTGERLMNPFVVEIRDQYDDPMEGVTVAFVVSAGGGLLSHETVLTDANGQAESTLTLGIDPGTNTVEVSVEGIAETTTFNAEANLPPPIPTSLEGISGNNQTDLTGERLMNPFVVEVRDQYDDPMEGVTVAFVVSAGSGSLSHTSTITDANGLAQSTLTLGIDPGTNTVEVSVEGIAETATFNAEASLPPPMPTALEGVSGNNQTDLTGERLMNPFVVEVRDQYDDPMEGVTVSLCCQCRRWLDQS